MSLISEEELGRRLNNPLNLINQMRNGLKASSKRANAMSLFVKPSIDKAKEEAKIELIPASKPAEVVKFNPFKPAEKPSERESEETSLATSDVVDDIDIKIKLALAHDNALALTNKAIEMLTNKLDDVDAEKIPSVINAASKVVEGIRRERIDKDKNYKNDQHVHHHFYMPEQRKIESYEVIEVTG